MLGLVTQYQIKIKILLSVKSFSICFYIFLISISCATDLKQCFLCTIGRLCNFTYRSLKKRRSLGSGLSGTVICCLDNRVCLVGRARVRGCGGILFLRTTFRVSLRPFTPFSLVYKNGIIFGKLTFNFHERFV